MTTNASSTTYGRTSSVRAHSSAAIRPKGESRITPSTTSPNSRCRPCVQTVTKYTPSWA